MDEDEIESQLHTIILEKGGFEVVWASSPVGALDVLKDNTNFDAIFVQYMNLKMLKMHLPAMPVIVFGIYQPEQLAEAEAQGIIGYIPHPVHPKEIYRACSCRN